MVNEQAVHSGDTSKPIFLRRFPSQQDSLSHPFFSLEQELLEIASGTEGSRSLPGPKQGASGP